MGKNKYKLKDPTAGRGTTPNPDAAHTGRFTFSPRSGRPNSATDTATELAADRIFSLPKVPPRSESKSPKSSFAKKKKPSRRWKSPARGHMPRLKAHLPHMPRLVGGPLHWRTPTAPVSRAAPPRRASHQRARETKNADWHPGPPPAVHLSWRDRQALETWNKTMEWYEPQFPLAACPNDFCQDPYPEGHFAIPRYHEYTRVGHMRASVRTQEFNKWRATMLHQINKRKVAVGGVGTSGFDSISSPAASPSGSSRGNTNSNANTDTSKTGASGRASGSRASSFDGTSAGGKLKHDFLYVHERQELGIDGLGGTDAGALSGYSSCFKSLRSQLSNMSPRRALSPPRLPDRPTFTVKMTSTSKLQNFEPSEGSDRFQGALVGDGGHDDLSQSS